MFNSNKSQYGSLLSTFVCMFLLVMCASYASAEDNYVNLPPDKNMMGIMSLDSDELPFDPNDYTFLVYDPCGGESSVVAAMEHILDRQLTQDEIRTGQEGRHVTPEDLATHDILIVGWNAYGDTGGLDPNVLLAGIDGRIILTGHDLDYHTVHDLQAAETCLVQAIDYVLKGGPTGLITLGCIGNYPYINGFPYLPEEWGVSATVVIGEDVNEFTEEGLASGVYDGLEPNKMSDWGYSYHDIFDINQALSFVAFELGGNGGNDIITVARTPPTCHVTKTSNVAPGDCNEPNDIITYTITYNADGHSDDNVTMTDYLPEGVDFVGVQPEYVIWYYDEQLHAVIWDIGNVGPDDTNSIGIIVKVNNLAVPLRELRNRAILEGDTSYNIAEITTPVCCWNTGIIYVDDNAAGSDNGMSWNNAFRDLQDALDRANFGCGSEIWVAAGTYIPSIPQGQSATFALVSGIPVYGHFEGNETSINQRNLYNPNNETILTGLSVYAYNVVTASNAGEPTTLDGFTIKGASSAGIKTEYANLIITNCIISGNASNGINAVNSRFTITDCTIQDNNNRGINVNSLLGPSLLSRNIISNNGVAGIYCANIGSDLKVTNNWIYHNCWYATEAGIFVDWANPAVVIRNNTVVANPGYGIATWNDTDAVITNCIIWNNENDLGWCEASYSWLTANGDPHFVNPDSNNFHLDTNSPCIDKGINGPITDPNETDIDGECRITDGDSNGIATVDMGGDEIYKSKADINGDGVVNFVDYAIFAFAWGEPNSDVNLAGDIDIEMDDLVAFCADWLWVAPWSDLYETLMSQPAGSMGMASEAMEFGESIGLMPSSADEPQAIQAEQTVFTEMQIEELIEWFEQVWESDAEVREAITEADMQEFLDLLKEQL